MKSQAWFIKRILGVAVLSIAALFSSVCFGVDYTDIYHEDPPRFHVSPPHLTRFTSGKVVYVESMVEDQWASRFWGADGRMEFPGGWWFTEPAFDIQIKDDPKAESSISLVKGWQWVLSKELPKTDRGSRHYVVELKNTISPMTLRVHTLLDGTAVFVRWLEMTNDAEKPVALTAVSPWSTLLWPASHEYTYGYQVKDNPGNEGWIQWHSLPKGITKVESLKGNGQDDPVVIIRNENKGEYFIAQLAWSANWRFEFDNQEDGPRLKFGPIAIDALRVIAPGETIVTPALHLGLVEGDLDATVQAMHDHLRRSVLPKPRKNSFRIQYVIPGDQGYTTGPDYNEANVMKHIDVAAEIGAELVEMDAGWYDVYGEWIPSASRFPNGLEPIRKYAKSKGLLFGLQTEVEGGRRGQGNTKLAKEHPNWFGPQDVLDLTKPEVAVYMESELSRVIETHKFDLYRHEFIPASTIPGQNMFTHEWFSTSRHGFMENSYWRYYEAYNTVWNNIRAKYPELVLQHCANGGTRDDLNNMSCFHEVYSNEGELNRVFPSYSGKTLSLPPEVLVIGGGARFERGHLDTYLRFTFTLQTPWLHSGVAPGLDYLGQSIKERYIHYTELYKNFIRPILPTSKMYHHAPLSATGGVTSTPWFAVEFTSPDRRKGWATIALLSKSDEDTYFFRPRGLDRGKTYKVTFDNSGDNALIDGFRLMQDGILIRLEAAMSSELLLFEAK